jgi:hypothetical protein
MKRNSPTSALGRFGAFALVDVAVVVLSTEASTSKEFIVGKKKRSRKTIVIDGW